MANHNSYMVIIKSDRKNFAETMTEEESRIIGEHFLYLKHLKEEKKLIPAGPTLDDSGGCIFLNVINLEEANEIMTKDPSVKNGILRPEFHPFRISLCQCNE